VITDRALWNKSWQTIDDIRARAAAVPRPLTRDEKRSVAHAEGRAETAKGAPEWTPEQIACKAYHDELDAKAVAFHQARAAATAKGRSPADQLAAVEQLLHEEQ
jgi:hypothetical protein